MKNGALVPKKNYMQMQTHKATHYHVNYIFMEIERHAKGQFFAEALHVFMCTQLKAFLKNTHDP